MTEISRGIDVAGDQLHCLHRVAPNVSASLPPRLLVLGIDARSVHTRAGLAVVLRRHSHAIRNVPSSVSHIIVALDQAEGRSASWMRSRLDRWASSIHRRIQRSRGVDVDITVIVIDCSIDPGLVAERVNELAHRPPGVNAAAVLTADEVRGQTITQASTNNFI